MGFKIILGWGMAVAFFWGGSEVGFAETKKVRGDASGLPMPDISKEFPTANFEGAQTVFPTFDFEVQSLDLPEFQGGLREYPLFDWKGSERVFPTKAFEVKDYENQREWEMKKAGKEWSKMIEEKKFGDERLALRPSSLDQKEAAQENFLHQRFFLWVPREIREEELPELINRGAHVEEPTVGRGFNARTLTDEKQPKNPSK